MLGNPSGGNQLKFLHRTHRTKKKGEEREKQRQTSVGLALEEEQSRREQERERELVCEDLSSGRKSSPEIERGRELFSNRREIDSI